MTLEKKIRTFAAAAALSLGVMYGTGCEEEESYCCEKEGHKCPVNNVCTDNAANGESTKSLTATRSDGKTLHCDCVYRPPSNDYMIIDESNITPEGLFEQYIRTTE